MLEDQSVTREDQGVTLEEQSVTMERQSVTQNWVSRLTNALHCAGGSFLFYSIQ